jgi:hypothetical protein
MNKLFGKIGQISALAAGAFLVLGVWNVGAANRWYSARTVNGRTQPLSAGTQTILMPDGTMLSVAAASVTNGLVDLVISLYNNPQGDDDGNTQGGASNASQDAYEKIIQYPK